MSLDRQQRRLSSSSSLLSVLILLLIPLDCSCFKSLQTVLTTTHSRGGNRQRQQHQAYLMSPFGGPHSIALPALTRSLKTTLPPLAITTAQLIGRGGQQQQEEALTTMTMTLVPDVIANSLQTGPYGVLALTAIAATVCLPITQYRNLYGISVGYGLSIATIGFMLLQVLDVATMPVIARALLASSLFYGIRLAGYLLVRDLSGWKPLTTGGEFPRLQRIPFAISLSLFYGLMTTPLLYALRTAPNLLAVSGSWQEQTVLAGTIMAWTGAVLEAVADAQKFLCKARHADDKNRFHGPDQWTYRLVRHPNYLGEVTFWLGIWLAGVPSFDWLAGTCGTLGLFGIVSIMRGAAKKLEQRHQEKYGDDPNYKKWTSKVRAPLFPFVRGT